MLALVIVKTGELALLMVPLVFQNVLVNLVIAELLVKNQCVTASTATTELVRSLRLEKHNVNANLPGLEHYVTKLTIARTTNVKTVLVLTKETDTFAIAHRVTLEFYVKPVLLNR